MVFWAEEESYFDAPIEKVWKLFQAHSTQSERIHPHHTNQKGHRVDENSSEVSWDEEILGKSVSTKRRLTMYPPLGWTAVVLEGPLAGSKYFTYYASKGDKTAVYTVGDFTSPTFSDREILQAVQEFLARVFEEDSTFLKTIS